MNAKHYAALEAAIQKWLDTTEGVDDLQVVIGDRTVEMMATAARSVFDAMEDSLAHADRNGLMATA